MNWSFVVGMLVGWLATMIGVVFALALCYVADRADRRAGLK